MNSIALPVFAIDPCIIAGAPVPATSGSDPLTSAFAELLHAAEPMPEDQRVPVAKVEEQAPKSGLRSDPALPLDEIAEPAKEADKPDDDSAAIAYALVANMPVLPTPAPVETAGQSASIVVPKRGNPERHTPEREITVQVAALPMVTPVETPRTESTPAPKPTPASESTPDAESIPIPQAGPQLRATPAHEPTPKTSTPEQPAPRNIPPVELATAIEAQPAETGQPKLPVGTAAPDATPQRVILEARITKQPAASERTKPVIRKDAVTSDAPPPEQEPVRLARPAVTEVSKAEFAASEHSASEHKDEHPAIAPERQPAPAHPEHATAPVAGVETERLSSARAASHEPVHQTSATPDIPEPPTGDQTPLKRMDLRIPDANGGGVTVRLQERAGAVHVSVRSNDAQLANGVAETLPELGRSLDRQGFRAETWTPTDASRVAEATPEALLRTGSTREHTGETARPHSEPAALIQPDQTQSGNESADSHRKPDWREEMYKRPKRQSDENFKEYLS